jgi:hypothetical protein
MLHGVCKRVQWPSVRPAPAFFRADLKSCCQGLTHRNMLLCYNSSRYAVPTTVPRLVHWGQRGQVCTLLLLTRALTSPGGGCCFKMINLYGSGWK